jgi:hypothetical protein
MKKKILNTEVFGSTDTKRVGIKEKLLISTKKHQPPN